MVFAIIIHKPNHRQSMPLLLTRPKNSKDCTKTKAGIQPIVPLQPSKRQISIPSLAVQKNLGTTNKNMKIFNEKTQKCREELYLCQNFFELPSDIQEMDFKEAEGVLTMIYFIFH